MVQFIDEKALVLLGAPALRDVREAREREGLSGGQALYHRGRERQVDDRPVAPPVQHLGLVDALAPPERAHDRILIRAVGRAVGVDGAVAAVFRPADLRVQGMAEDRDRRRVVEDDLAGRDAR